MRTPRHCRPGHMPPSASRSPLRSYIIYSWLRVGLKSSPPAREGGVRKSNSAQKNFKAVLAKFNRVLTGKKARAHFCELGFSFRPLGFRFGETAEKLPLRSRNFHSRTAAKKAPAFFETPRRTLKFLASPWALPLRSHGSLSRARADGATTREPFATPSAFCPLLIS